MNPKHKPNGTNTKPVDQASGVLTGHPTIAANTGAGLSRKELHAFAEADLTVAEWLRLPAPRGRCRLSGLSRTGLNEAIDRRDIRAITIRKPGAIRGVKLINKASLLAWLHRLDAEQNSAGEQPSAVAESPSTSAEPTGVTP